EWLIRKIRQWRPAPERQGVAQPLARNPRLPRLQRAAPLSDERLEAVEIDLAGCGLEDVAMPMGRQQSVPERLPQMRDVALDDLRRTRGRLSTPERVEQAIGRDRLTTMQEEHRQK